MTTITPPSLADIQSAAERLQGRIVKTPTVSLTSDRFTPYLPDGSEVICKLELFQNAGSFKARGALLAVDALTSTQREAGITAVSAGNHAIAASWAAASEGVSAKVVMPKTADPLRVSICEALGAEVVLVDDVHAAFTEMNRIVEEEHRTAIHPFEGVYATTGTATCGLEFLTEHPDLDALVVPIGGGGLISGMSLIAKMLNPHCRVIGVEPEGADTFFRSFAKGEPVTINKVQTIADSLGAPLAMPYSFGVSQPNVDEIVTIPDDHMLKAMAVLYDGLKIATEPACAASTAAVMGALNVRLAGQKVGVIACGANISAKRFEQFVGQGQALL